MELKFVSTTKPKWTSPDVQRRQKLVTQIDRQIAHIEKLKSGEQVRASWVWMDDAGKYYVPLKYGRQSIELKKGMFAAQVSNLDEASDALTGIRELVLKGEYDTHLSKASSDIRSRFAAKAK